MDNMKYDSIIKRIDLDTATFRGTGAYIVPTYINYFFGNNGTGKSTIARALKSGSGVTYPPGRTAADYNTLVFDQDFIDRNMPNLHNLPGVFTMAEENADIQRQIDEAAKKQEDAQKAVSDATTEMGKLTSAREKLEKRHHTDVWNGTDAYRTELFPLTQKGFGGSKKRFADELEKHSPVKHDEEELKRMYDSAYSESSKRYQRFSTITDTSVLDSVEGSEILGISIVNSSDTDLAKFWKRIGAEEWVRKGHADYHLNAGGQCPYCSQTLLPDFEKLLTDSFDDQYEQNLKKLNAFLEDYRSVANAVFIPLSHIPDELYPAIDVTSYNDKLAALKGVIAENIEKIKEKVAEPARTVTLTETAALMDEIEEIIKGFNELIDKNNAIVAAGPAKQQECADMVFERMAFDMQGIIDAYKQSYADYDSQIKAQQGIIDKQGSVVTQLGKDIRRLNSQTKETESAMRNINAMLKDAGFQGFEVVPHWDEVRQPDGTIKRVVQSPVRNYAVVRTDEETGEQKVAENLSEGEKNFIAFLYFQQQVFGGDNTEKDAKPKIVVIDDPVSSMDSGTLFIVGAQIRKMIEICRNSAVQRGAVVSGNFIKQIFILTHNAYFHKEVTYPYASQWDFVSFYLIRKINNKSSVKLFDKVDPDRPTTRMNVNPVKNSYAALWDAYGEVKSGIPLKSVMRRILEYYFLQLCGYDSDDLRQCILVDHKADFIEYEDGVENSEKYELAKVLLAYITSDITGVNDGIHYTDEFLDEQMYRDTFEMIFRCMGQGQHFDMMTGKR